MKFQPKTDREILESNLIPEGKYKAEIFDAIEEDDRGNKLLTQKGDPKIIVILKVFVNDKVKQVKCTLTPSFIKLLKHFCYSTGLDSAYDEGEVTAEKIKDVRNYFLVEISTNEFTGDNGKKILNSRVTDFYPISESNDFEDDKLPF